MRTAYSMMTSEFDLWNWGVAIADPRSEGVAAQRNVPPGRPALAASGHAACGVSEPFATGRIIDPRRGRPTSMDPCSVSVLAGAACDKRIAQRACKRRTAKEDCK